MDKVAVVIWQDRHTDTTAHVFRSAVAAKAWARAQAEDMAKPRFAGQDSLEVKEWGLNPSMIAAGWIYHVTYGESDGLRVIMTEVQ